jgi:hypothetical protein
MNKLLYFKNQYTNLDLGKYYKSYNLTHINHKADTKDFLVKNILKLNYDIVAYLFSI